MFCNKCGNPIPLDSEFCSKCGAKVNKDSIENNSQTTNINNEPVNNAMYNNIGVSTSSYNQSSNTKNNNKNIIIIIACIIGAILITIIGYNVFNQIRLHIIDNKVQKEAEKLGDIDDFNTNDSSSVSKDQSKKTYNVGDSVKLVDGSSWHVIGKNSDSELILLSDVLTKEKSYYGNDSSEQSQKYENSIIKQYLDSTYLPSLRQSLLANNGDVSNLSVRLIKAEEYLKLVGQKFDSSCRVASRDNTIEYSEVKKAEEYLILTSDFWTMSNIRTCNPSDPSYGAYHIMNHGDFTTIFRDEVASDGVVSGTQGNSFGIRPVIETSIKNIK